MILRNYTVENRPNISFLRNAQPGSWLGWHLNEKRPMLRCGAVPDGESPGSGKSLTLLANLFKNVG